ncbi:MAG: PKD domain-containing protein, partial [Flavobacteriales bacterium]|nr:PKD domain-containing protein [Flavobacteriales bacterium]
MKTLSAFLLALALPASLFAQEICNNGIDDDGDGLIDLNDPDCPCSTVLMSDSLPSYIRNHSFEVRGCCPLGFVSPLGPPYLDCATGWHQATSSTSDYFHECGYSPPGMPLPPPDGDGAVGFYAMTTYKEYVGTCLTWPLPSNPLIAGTTYTISLWIAGAAADDQHSQSPSEGQMIGALFPDQLPLAIFGYADACVPFPVPVLNSTRDCIGDEPGWNELGRVLVQPSWDWVRVSITFTPTQDIHSIMIGSACDLPVSFTGRTIVDDQGANVTLMPYFIVDDLMLTIAGDQVLSPTATTGNLCANNVMATAQPPAGATGFQWYLDGVALPGQTGSTLNVSAGNYGPGLYTMTSTFSGECLMGSAPVAPAASPLPWPWLHPTTGCAPLSVAFADTTGGGTSTVLWDMGDGTTSNLAQHVHTYNAPGVYDVALTVIDAQGCQGTLLLDSAVVVHPPVNAQITATPNPALVEDPMVVLAGAGTSNIISWWWDLGAADPPVSTDQDVQAHFPPVPGDYPVVLVVTSADGCADTVRSVVHVIDPG